jgi:hypothetical protein
MRPRALAAAALAIASFAPLAQAEPTASQKALANQLFDDAQALMAAGKLADACPKYAESHRLDPQLGALLHLGECYERKGTIASAWSTFKDALEIAAARKDVREAVARAEVAKLAAIVPKMVVVVDVGAPADLEVRSDGNLIGRLLWNTALPIDAGRHRITAKGSGIEPWSLTVDVPASGPAVRVEVPRREAAAAAAPERATAADVTPSRSRQKTVGFVVGAIGVVGLAVGGVSKAMGFGKQGEIDAHCDASRACDQVGMDAVNAASTFQTVGTISLVAGAAALGAGFVLIVSSPSLRDAHTAIGPMLVPNGGGLGVGGRF